MANEMEPDATFVFIGIDGNGMVVLDGQENVNGIITASSGRIYREYDSGNADFKDALLDFVEGEFGYYVNRIICL